MKAIALPLLCFLCTVMDVHSQAITVILVTTDSNSVTLSWALEGVTATVIGYSISYSNTDTQCFDDSGTVFVSDAGETTHTLTDLEESTEYTITVTAMFTGQGPVDDSITATTSAAVPSDAPTFVITSQVNSSSITVEWGAVECIHRNGDITCYTVQYSVLGSGSSRNASECAAMVLSLNELAPATFYEIEVAAENSAGTGVYSASLRVLTLVEAPVVTVDSTTATTVFVSWSSAGLVVDMYKVMWERDISGECSDEDEGSTFIRDGNTNYIIMGLEEDSSYTITVTATNEPGSAVSDPVTGMTEEAVPSAPPNVTSSDVTSSSITIRWGAVDCIHRNGDITGYSVRYGVQGSAEGDRTVINSSAVIYEISGLTSSTSYCIEVAAVNNVGIGVYSVPLCETSLMAGLFISFMGSNLPNHSYVDLTLVGDAGDGSDSVQCHTDLRTCCNTGAGDDHGDWYAPGDQNRLPFSNEVGDIYEIRGAQQVDLHRRNNGNTSGIYHCSIETNAVNDNDGMETILIGLYAGGGDATILGNMTFNEDSDFNGGTPQFTLTCTSTGGPVTTVTWTRDSNPVLGGITVLDNPVTAQYIHTLTVTGRLGGLYQCTVSNNKPSHDSASFTVQVASKPTNLIAVQEGPTGIEIMWTPPSPLGDTSGYVIYYSGGSSGSVDVSGGSTTSHLLTGLQNGATYTISIVGKSKHFFSDSADYANDILLNPPPGQPKVTVILERTTTISISWSVPSGSVVERYEVMWEREGNETITDGSTSYTITGLEEDSSYIITVTAINAIGSVVSEPVTGKTTSAESSEFPTTITIIVGGVIAIILIIALMIIVVVALCRLRCRLSAKTPKQELMRSEDVLTNTNEAYELASAEENVYEDVP